MFEKISEENFVLYAAKYYNNIQCHDTEEFYDDLKRFNYIKRLVSKYKESGEMRERLVLNHLIVLYNVFNDHATKMIFLKLKDDLPVILPFLVLMKRLPHKVCNINGFNTIYTSDIPLDPVVVDILRKMN